MVLTAANGTMAGLHGDSCMIATPRLDTVSTSHTLNRGKRVSLPLRLTAKQNCHPSRMQAAKENCHPSRMQAAKENCHSSGMQAAKDYCHPSRMQVAKEYCHASRMFPVRDLINIYRRLHL